MIPKGFIFNCPTCGKPLYRVNNDVSINEQINESLPKFVAIFPQDLLSNTSTITQNCAYCLNDFDFLSLIKSYWRK